MKAKITKRCPKCNNTKIFHGQVCGMCGEKALVFISYEEAKFQEIDKFLEKLE